MAEPDEICELRIAVATMDERMKTMEANLDRTLAEFKTDIADRATADRRWTIGIILAAIGVAAGFLALIG